MDIWLQSSDYCGNLKLSICRNFEYPKFASEEGFKLVSCLSVTGIAVTKQDNI